MHAINSFEGKGTIKPYTNEPQFQNNTDAKIAFAGVFLTIAILKYDPREKILAVKYFQEAMCTIAPDRRLAV